MSTDQLLEIVLDVDVDKELACGSRFHDVETEWHSGPAAFWMRGPCNAGGLRCADFRAAVAACGGCFCHSCDRIHFAEDISFIEL